MVGQLTHPLPSFKMVGCLKYHPKEPHDHQLTFLHLAILKGHIEINIHSLADIPFLCHTDVPIQTGTALSSESPFCLPVITAAFLYVHKHLFKIASGISSENDLSSPICSF